jgi:hypothetical protein
LSILKPNVDVCYQKEERPMTDDDSDATPPMKRVRSDLAAPSRPADSSDVLQPIEPVTPVHPPRQSVLDEDLAEDVRAGLAQEGRLEHSALAVTVRQGIVTVAGTVASEYQRSLVTATLNTIPGVLNVKNLLQVR